MQVDYRTRQRRINQPREELVRDFSELQKTEFEPDKIDFESFFTVRNMVHKEGNAVLRRGVSAFATPDDPLGIHIARGATNVLYSVLKDGASNSKITSINRATGAESDDITGITGNSTPSMADLRGFLYVANGDTTIQTYDGSSAGTLAIPGGQARLIASDQSRLWAVSDETPEEILYFSINDGSGIVSTFSTGASTTIDRAGVADSKIVKYTCLKGVSNRVVACSQDRFEVHGVPDFATAGITSFPASIGTTRFAFDNIGVESPDAVIGVDEYAFVKTNDGILHRINVRTGEKKEFSDDKRMMDKMTWANAALGYDSRNELLYITGTNSSQNDRTIVFNVREENFSYFDGFIADQWTSDGDNVYFMDFAADVIQDAFASDDYTDLGAAIPWELETQASYGGSFEFFKKAFEFIMNVKIFEETTVKMRLFTEQMADSSKASSNTVDKEFSFSPVIFTENVQNFNMGMWGGAQIAFGTPQIEYLTANDKINTQFHRASVRFTGSNSNPFELRGVGLKYFLTAKKAKDVTYT